MAAKIATTVETTETTEEEAEEGAEEVEESTTDHPHIAGTVRGGSTQKNTTQRVQILQLLKQVFVLNKLLLSTKTKSWCW